MRRAERAEALQAAQELLHLAETATAVARQRQQVDAGAKAAAEAFSSRWTALRVPGGTVKVAVFDIRADQEHLECLRIHQAQVGPTAEQAVALEHSVEQVTSAIQSIDRVRGLNGWIAGAATRQEASDAAQWVKATRERASTEQWSTLLNDLTPVTAVALDPLSRDEVIFGLLQAAGSRARLVSSPEVAHAIAGHHAVKELETRAHEAWKQIKSVGERIRDRDVQAALQEMPLDSLRAATGGRVRLGVLEKNGFESVSDVIQRKGDLWHLSGLSRQSATHIIGAAEKMQVLVNRETPLRIDVARKEKDTSRLLRLLNTWGTAKAVLLREDQLIKSTLPLRRKLDAVASAGPDAFLAVSSADDLDLLTAAVAQAADLRLLADKLNGLPRSAWDDFLARPADYFGWLRLFGFEVTGDGAGTGQLSKKLIDRVRKQDLDTSRLHTLSLRGYQDFGARFALAQRKVVIGDEMGLGKTVEALAVLAHLHAKGASHTVVVCPASVVSNWAREVTRFSDVDVWVLHGVSRDDATSAWLRKGGVAVTTFETLPSLGEAFGLVEEIRAIVIDEAHYIKNPQARRTLLSRQLIDRSRYALLLTGTPIENRLSEFKALISYLQPKLVDGLDEYPPVAFPRLVAPAYLRRNQEDVLLELPERIDVDEWLPMSRTEMQTYRDAVFAGNFMAMRRAAMLGESRATKVQRLLEIVAEARANHRKVLVFSYFRDVLETVIKQVDGVVLGPLNGSVSAGRRQQMVDDFTAADPGAVLVAQVTAGGVGLNIQAGSVVILCEPQVKPSMEAQAIARAHRMGQTRTVQVHRLLSDEGVDKRMVEILAEKQAIFDQYAKVSHTARTAPEALDLTEVALATQIIAEERERLARKVMASTDDGQGEIR